MQHFIVLLKLFVLLTDVSKQVFGTNKALSSTQSLSDNVENNPIFDSHTNTFFCAKQRKATNNQTAKIDNYQTN